MLCSYIHHVEMKAFLKTHLLSRELSTEPKESPSRNMCAKSHPSSKRYCHHWCRHDWCRYHWCRTFDVDFLMPVTIDARHDWCPWSFFDASHFWCPSLFMPRKLFWCQSQSRLMSVTIDARHHWCPSLLMPVPSNAGLNHNPEFY